MKALKIISLTSLPLLVEAAAIGQLGNDAEITDSATICFSVGLQASISGLDNFTLQRVSGSGAAGTRYEGKDEFYLEANGAVRVLAEANPLTNGSYTVTPDYYFDQREVVLATEVDATHAAYHELHGEFIMRAISEQLAGDYSGKVFLTVTADVGGLQGCGGQVLQYPASGEWGTLLWEDLYPSEGDADYNDLVVHFRIEEQYGADNQLESITMDFVPVGRGAGFNHSLGLSLDGSLDKSKNVDTETTPVFIADADITVSYTNLDNSQTHQRYYSADDDITIFSSSLVAMGDQYANVYPYQDAMQPHWMSTVQVHIDSASLIESNGLATGEFNYRPFLHVNNTNSDIDLYEVNTGDGMISNNGYPFGMLVPDAIYWPAERVHINTVYPYFDEYRQWLNGESDTLSEQAEYWYQYPDPDAGEQLQYYELDLGIE